MSDPSLAGDADPLERRWLALAREGDEQAFAALVRLHQDRLYRVALRMTGEAEAAADILQDTFLQAWQHLPGFRGEAALSTWLTRITINRCHNLRRAARPSQPLPDEASLPTAPAAESVALAARRREAVRQAVVDLSFNQRAPLVLTTFGGYTYAEAGRILGITETAAKLRAHRARRALAARLQEWR
ncbi:RNA polymerase sigma factor [Geodermatophilus nigrescens]